MPDRIVQTIEQNQERLGQHRVALQDLQGRLVNSSQQTPLTPLRQGIPQRATTNLRTTVNKFYNQPKVLPQDIDTSPLDKVFPKDAPGWFKNVIKTTAAVRASSVWDDAAVSDRTQMMDEIYDKLVVPSFLTHGSWEDKAEYRTPPTRDEFYSLITGEKLTQDKGTWNSIQEFFHAARAGFQEGMETQAGVVGKIFGLGSKDADRNFERTKASYDAKKYGYADTDEAFNKRYQALKQQQDTYVKEHMNIGIPGMTYNTAAKIQNNIMNHHDDTTLNSVLGWAGEFAGQNIAYAPLFTASGYAFDPAFAATSRLAQAGVKGLELGSINYVLDKLGDDRSQAEALRNGAVGFALGSLLGFFGRAKALKSIDETAHFTSSGELPRLTTNVPGEPVVSSVRELTNKPKGLLSARPDSIPQPERFPESNEARLLQDIFDEHIVRGAGSEVSFNNFINAVSKKFPKSFGALQPWQKAVMTANWKVLNEESMSLFKRGWGFLNREQRTAAISLVKQKLADATQRIPQDTPELNQLFTARTVEAEASTAGPAGKEVLGTTPETRLETIQNISQETEKVNKLKDPENNPLKTAQSINEVFDNAVERAEKDRIKQATESTKVLVNSPQLAKLGISLPSAMMRDSVGAAMAGGPEFASSWQKAFKNPKLIIENPLHQLLYAWWHVNQIPDLNPVLLKALTKIIINVGDESIRSRAAIIKQSNDLMLHIERAFLGSLDSRIGRFTKDGRLQIFRTTNLNPQFNPTQWQAQVSPILRQVAKTNPEQVKLLKEIGDTFTKMFNQAGKP